MQIADKLSMLRSKHNGIIQNMVTTIIVNVLKIVGKKLILISNTDVIRIISMNFTLRNPNDLN